MPKAIKTTYHGATETKPARIAASDSDGNRITISAESDRDSAHLAAARALEAKMKWPAAKLVGGSIKGGIAWVEVKPWDLSIKAILRVIRDSGTTAGAFEYTEVLTGRIVRAQTSTANNIPGLTRELNGGDWEGNQRRTYEYHQEVGAREFARITKGWEHIGSNPEDFAKFIREALSK